jgi:DNA-binding NarL/FixJ family response regulator
VCALPTAGGLTVVRVLVVDDQALVRAGFRKLLDGVEGISVVGEAADGRQGVDVATTTCPDVVLMDIRMPHLDGIEATRRITAATDSRVLILTTYDMDEYVYNALRAGASGFLLKDAPPEQLIAAIHALAAGDALLDPSVTRRLIETFARAPVPDPQMQARLAQLSARERDVLARIARGRSNAEIGAELFLSAATVKSHVSNVLAKLAVRDRVQAVVYAYESGLVKPGAG